MANAGGVALKPVIGYHLLHNTSIIQGINPVRSFPVC
jgi:hypothetical protein